MPSSSLPSTFQSLSLSRKFLLDLSTNFLTFINQYYNFFTINQSTFISSLGTYFTKMGYSNNEGVGYFHMKIFLNIINNSNLLQSYNNIIISCISFKPIYDKYNSNMQLYYTDQSTLKFANAFYNGNVQTMCNDNTDPLLLNFDTSIQTISQFSNLQSFSTIINSIKKVLKIS